MNPNRIFNEIILDDPVGTLQLENANSETFLFRHLPVFHKIEDPDRLKIVREKHILPVREEKEDVRQEHVLPISFFHSIIYSDMLHYNGCTLK